MKRLLNEVELDTKIELKLIGFKNNKIYRYHRLGMREENFCWIWMNEEILEEYK